MYRNTEHLAIVLGVIESEGETFGREIARIVEDEFGCDIIGSVYAMLNKLESLGYIEKRGDTKARWRLMPYSITRQGEKELTRLREHYRKVAVLLVPETELPAKLRVRQFATA